MNLEDLEVDDNGLFEFDSILLELSLELRENESLDHIEKTSRKFKPDRGQFLGSRRGKKPSTDFKKIDGEDKNQLKITSLWSKGQGKSLERD